MRGATDPVWWLQSGLCWCILTSNIWSSLLNVPLPHLFWMLLTRHFPPCSPKAALTVWTTKKLSHHCHPKLKGTTRWKRSWPPVKVRAPSQCLRQSRFSFPAPKRPVIGLSLCTPSGPVCGLASVKPDECPFKWPFDGLFNARSEKQSAL